MINSTKAKIIKVCKQCVLDNYDYPEIIFDKDGICDICHTNIEIIKNNILEGEEARKKLELLKKNLIKKKTKEGYDCLIGVGGGVDSTYLAYLCKELGLNPLVVHVDGGWNTSVSVNNIENVIKLLGFHFVTEVINWEDMREAQKAFIRADVLDIDLPFDNALFATIYKLAEKHKIKNVLLGHNAITEGYMPSSFTHYKLDSLNLRYIFKKFSNHNLRKFPIIGPIKNWYYAKILKIETYFPLNWVAYDKAVIKKFIAENLNWIDYGNKHYDNLFTRFYQGYILPKKFKIDKRKIHLSSLIISKQITRERALEIINTENPYTDNDLLEADKEFFIKKLQMSEEDFNEYIKRPPISHRDYPSWLKIYDKLRPIKRVLKLKKRTF